MLSLPLRLLFRGVYRFPGLPSNPCFLRWNTCFLRQYTVLPRFLRAVPRVLRSGGGAPCVARRHLQPRTWCTYFCNDILIPELPTQSGCYSLIIFYLFCSFYILPLIQEKNYRECDKYTRINYTVIYSLTTCGKLI